MRPEARREKIVDLVRTRQRVSVDSLAEGLNTSKETIRRDLTELSDRGLVRKVHGGAVLPDMQGEGIYAARMGQAMQEKRAIARAAAALFDAGDTLFVDTGTTTLAFAEALARRDGMTVITNGLAIAQILGRGGKTSSVFLVGGAFSEDAGETLGALAVEQISGFHTGHAVLTVGALGPGGVFDYNIEEAHVARAMIRQAGAVTVLADSAKFNRTALFPVATLGGIARLVTDAAPAGALAVGLREAGVEVIVAPPLVSD